MDEACVYTPGRRSIGDRGMKGMVIMTKNDRVIQQDFLSSLWRGPFIEGDQVDVTEMDGIAFNIAAAGT